MTKKIFSKIRNKHQSEESVRREIGVFVSIWGLISNLFLFALKFLVGWLSQSVSITADAVNNLSDSAASLVSLVGFMFSSKPADKEHPYGHQRFEYISGLMVSLLVVFVGMQFVFSSVDRLLNPQSTLLTPLMLVILLCSILIKVHQSFVYRSASKEINSNTLEANSKDSLNDVYTTLTVLVSGTIEMMTGLRLDGWIGLALALYIIYSGINMIRESMSDLLGRAPEHEEIEAIQAIIEKNEAVLGYHDLIIHSYGAVKRYATVDIEFDNRMSLEECHQIINTIEEEVWEQHGVNLVTHIDPVDRCDEKLNQAYKHFKQQLYTVDDQLKFHDLRVIELNGQMVANVDIVVYEGCPYDEKLLHRIIEMFLRENFTCDAVEITFDYNYFL